MKSWKQLLVVLLLAGIAACSTAQSSRDQGEKPTKAPPAGKYQKVSELVVVPAFIPGLGTLYVQLDALSAGPLLAYGRDGSPVSTG